MARESQLLAILGRLRCRLATVQRVVRAPLQLRLVRALTARVATSRWQRALHLVRLPAAAAFVLPPAQVAMQAVCQSKVAVVYLAVVARFLSLLVRVPALVVTFRCVLADT